MNVTKGSFIGTSRIEDLLNAMLQEGTRETDDIIKQVEEIGGDASASYSTCFNWHEDDGQLEKAMRTWAASDARAAAATWIDQRRLDYLQDLFLQIGFRQLMPSHAPD